jgi:hypothetical protein
MIWDNNTNTTFRVFCMTQNHHLICWDYLFSANISRIKRLWVHALHRDAYSHTSFGTMENMNATSIMEWTVCLHCKSTKGKHFSSHFALESVDSMTTTSNSASGLKPESGLMQVYPNQGPPRNANIVIKTSRKVWN